MGKMKQLSNLMRWPISALVVWGLAWVFYTMMLSQGASPMAAMFTSQGAAMPVSAVRLA